VPGTDKALPENSQPNLNKRVHLWSRNGRDRVISCYSQRAGPLFGGGVVRRLTSACSGLNPDRTVGQRGQSRRTGLSFFHPGLHGINPERVCLTSHC
jgi:hypothetical protein